MTDLEVLATVTKGLRERLHWDFKGERVSSEALERMNEMLAANMKDLRDSGRVQHDYNVRVYRHPTDPNKLTITFDPPLHWVPISFGPIEPSGG